MPEKTIECAVMFADIAGSTSLYERLGDQQAQDVISKTLARLSDITLRFGGVVIKTIGDEIMCRFPNASSAAEAACTMQEALEGESTAGAVSVSIRIGVHYGPAILEAGDVFGDAVNVAARMAAIAKARQIITTDETVEHLNEDLSERCREFDRASVKGKADEIIIHEVMWEEADEVTRMAGANFAPVAGAASVLKLKYSDSEVSVAPATVFVMGRGQQCNLTVETTLASRIHGRVEYRRGKFIYIDQSTNGTFVRTQDGKEVFLRREELPLWGQGIISLGKSVKEEKDHLVYFVCE